MEHYAIAIKGGQSYGASNCHLQFATRLGYSYFMNNEHQCREYDATTDDSNKCAGSVRQYESGSLNVALCDYH